MQKTSYDLRISDWSEDVCSSDLKISEGSARHRPQRLSQRQFIGDGYHLPPTLREARAAFDQVLARDPGDLDRRLTHRRDPRPAMLRERQPAEPDQPPVGGNVQAPVAPPPPHPPPHYTGRDTCRERGGP